MGLVYFTYMWGQFFVLGVLPVYCLKLGVDRLFYPGNSQKIDITHDEFNNVLIGVESLF